VRTHEDGDGRRRAVFATDFPADLIGLTMSRTIQGSSREDMRNLLSCGGRIRVLMLNPTDEESLA